QFRSALTPDGKIKFKDYCAVQMDVTPAVAADGRSFFPTWADGTLIGLGRDGLIGWRLSVNSFLYASPAIAPDGNIYIVAWSAGVLAVKADATLMNSAWPMFRANLRHTGVVNSPSH
ncbi:MAG TPA: hypothetical protein VHC44_10410, partial [Verrucomicrobiae bacterium]|nr:hypothetical protein [Verrucomicrobiae bacterium]